MAREESPTIPKSLAWSDEEMMIFSGEEFSEDWLLTHPSSMPDIGVTMKEFSTEADARQIGEAVLFCLRVFGTKLNLERLEAVTVAFDYAHAIAEIDPGLEMRESKPTHDEFAIGVGMTVPVFREGILKQHLVLDAQVASLLMKPDGPNFLLSIYLLCHEACHVHDMLMQDRAFPGLFGSKLTAGDAVLFIIAQVCWEEYVASLYSAIFAPPNLTKNYEMTFCQIISGVRERGNQHIRMYRRHGDVPKLLDELAREYGAALKYGAYLLGHVEGCGLKLSDAAPAADEAIHALPWVSSLFEEFALNLKSMSDSYGSWTGLEVFEPLKTTINKVFKAAGAELQPRPGGKYYLDVPFTPETMPFAL